MNFAPIKTLLLWININWELTTCNNNLYLDFIINIKNQLQRGYKDLGENTHDSSSK